MLHSKLTDAELVLDKTPNTSLQYLDALRNMKYQEAVWEIIAKQFEMAKLDEAKDAPLIQALDKATVPEKKSRPKRMLMVIITSALAFFRPIIWAFFKELLERNRENPQYQERLERLKRSLSIRR